MTAKEYLITDEQITNERKRRDYQTFQFDIGASWAREKYEIKLEEKNKETEQLKEILQNVRDYVNTPETSDYINRKLNLISTPETK